MGTDTLSAVLQPDVVIRTELSANEVAFDLPQKLMVGSSIAESAAVTQSAARAERKASFN